MTDIRAWLTLIRAPGLGPMQATRLLAQYDGDVQAALAAGRGCWRALGVGEAACDWLAKPEAQLLDADQAWLEAPGRHLVTCDQPRYPAALRDLADPPPWLFAIGDLDLLSTPAFAIVGSRNPSVNGVEIARDFAATLAEAGLAIVSGLATGIDSAAHAGALSANGMTVAVTGTGLDRVYPARNRELAHAIGESGLLVSEFALGTPAMRGNFPRRNRIIAGLAVGTLVVEAARQSGSLITARLALEAGREVFAIPGSIHNPLARGCHRLIREGAKLVETAEDIIEEIAPQLPRTATPTTPAVTGGSGAAPALDEDYRRLLECIGYAPTRIDELVERAGLTPDTVSSMLLILELQGLVASAPGGAFTRIG